MKTLVLLGIDTERGVVGLEDRGEPLKEDELRALAEWACAAAVEEHDVPPERSVVPMPAIFLELVLRDAREARRAHQEVLDRCNALKGENRALAARNAHARRARRWGRDAAARGAAPAARRGRAAAPARDEWLVAALGRRDLHRAPHARGRRAAA